MKAVYRLALTLTIAMVAVGLNAIRPSTAHAQASVPIAGTWYAGGRSYALTFEPSRDGRYFKGKITSIHDAAGYAEVDAWFTGNQFTFKYNVYLGGTLFDSGHGSGSVFNDPETGPQLWGDYVSDQGNGSGQFMFSR